MSSPGWKLIPEFQDYEMDPMGNIRPLPGKHKSITVTWNGPYVRLFKQGKLYTKRLTNLHNQTYPFATQRVEW